MLPLLTLRWPLCAGWVKSGHLAWLRKGQDSFQKLLHWCMKCHLYRFSIWVKCWLSLHGNMSLFGMSMSSWEPIRSGHGLTLCTDEPKEPRVFFCKLEGLPLSTSHGCHVDWMNSLIFCLVYLALSLLIREMLFSPVCVGFGCFHILSESLAMINWVRVRS